MVSRPTDRKVARNKWLFALNKNTDGRVIRFKARLLTNEFTQISGIDYFQVLASVLRFDTVRFLLSYVAKPNSKLRQFDIKTEF